MSDAFPTFAEVGEENARHLRLRKLVPDDEELIRLEQLEEQQEFSEACRVVNKNEWKNDDGSV